MRSEALLSLLAATGSYAAVMESLAEAPKGWQHSSSVASGQTLKLRIAMANPNHAALHQKIMDIATPGHELYGQHLSRSELKELTRPAPEATAAVKKWLADNGVTQISESGDWINFVAPVESAEKLLDAKFAVYHNVHNNDMQRIRTLKYSVPDAVKKYVDMIQPTTRFDEARPDTASFAVESSPAKSPKKGKKLPKLPGCLPGKVTPDCLRSLYNVPQEPTLKNDSIGFAAFANYLNQYPRYADLATFESKYAPSANGRNFTWTSINGGKLDQNSPAGSSEANADLQYLLALSHPTPINAYSTGGLAPLIPDLDQPDASKGQNEPYLDFLTYLLDQDDDELPHTLTTSYGEDEQSSPYSYRTKVCDMFGQLGARGVSILFSSGDTGVGSACQTNDGKNTTRFLPTFPGACPYVTSVGATTGIGPEVASTFSSGGFSDTWARPAYQDAAVSAYLAAHGDEWKGYYNATGRGFPDVAAQGENYRVIDKGSDVSFAGTSASAPTFAGVIALLNSDRISAGKKPLGFLNPFIYSKGYKALNDVTVGGSDGCTGTDMYSGETTPVVPGASWKAVKGWDPVTGHGTPDYKKLKPLVLAA